MSPDQVNAIFPVLGCFFVGLNIRQLYRDKDVKGLNLLAPLFFYSGQAWGVYFFYYLNQPYSFIAAGLLVCCQMTWYGMALYYTHLRKKGD